MSESNEWLHLYMRIKPEDVDALVGINGIEIARAIAPVLNQTILVADVYLGRDNPFRWPRSRPESLSAARITPDRTATRVPPEQAEHTNG